MPPVCDAEPVNRFLLWSANDKAGSAPGFADHSDPMLARLHVCEGLAFEAPFLYIADGNGGTDAPYHRVRRLDLSD